MTQNTLMHFLIIFSLITTLEISSFPRKIKLSYKYNFAAIYIY